LLLLLDVVIWHISREKFCFLGIDGLSACSKVMNHIYHIYFPVLVHQGHKEGTMWFGIFFPPDPEGLLCGEDCAFQVNIQKTALRRQRKHRLIFYWTERIISVYCWFMDVRHKHLHDRSKVC